MKDGLPRIYWTYRWVWSLVHLGILALAVIVGLVWAFTDAHGAHALASWGRWVNDLRAGLSSLIPYPWSH